MKNWMKRLTVAALSLSFLCSNIGVRQVEAKENDFRGVWISTVYSADYPSTQNNVEAQKKEYIEKLEKLQEAGMNAVVVQVRPKGDAFYKSELNPWSAVLTGTQGKDPGYDPMQFMIQEAHARGIEFHAWLNPYRITTSGTDVSELSADSMARQNPNWILTYNNAMYYNPEKAEVKQYIADTVKEIVQNYEVDGIHLDDYFYPSNYPLAEGEGRDGDQANERRAHVDDMVEMVHNAIKGVNINVEFGISPMGIWKNSTSDATGSATKGSEGYYAVFGDAKKWIDKGWVDYVAPQIYWEQGNAYADYETLVKWWSNATKDSDVDLYIGQGIYKDNVAEEIVEQLKINEKYSVDGSIYFSARDLLNNRMSCFDTVQAYYKTKGTDSDPADVTPPPITTPETPSVTPPVAVQKKTAYAREFPVAVNGTPFAIGGYVIEDYTYYKLRDVAAALSSTQKQFQVSWDEATQSIHIISGESDAESVSGIRKNTGTATATTSTAKLYFNNQVYTIEAYTINDYTYYKLRNLAELMDFGIEWNEALSGIEMNTTTKYVAP